MPVHPDTTSAIVCAVDAYLHERGLALDLREFCVQPGQFRLQSLTSSADSRPFALPSAPGGASRVRLKLVADGAQLIDQAPLLFPSRLQLDETCFGGGFSLG